MMAKLSERQRDKLPDNAFAYIDGAGDRHLPINDDEHIRNAMARFDQTDFEDAAAKERARNRIVAAARKHGIEIDDSDRVATSRG
jgi:hypothetical protein